MEDKLIRISGELHRGVKAEAAWRGMSIRAWVEKALRESLPGTRISPLPPDSEASLNAEE